MAVNVSIEGLNGFELLEKLNLVDAPLRTEVFRVKDTRWGPQNMNQIILQHLYPLEKKNWKRGNYLITQGLSDSAEIFMSRFTKVNAVDFGDMVIVNSLTLIHLSLTNLRRK